jgi:hypothetical protein
MKFSNEIETFINDYVKDLNSGTASVFAGAGLSIPAGFVNWTEMMHEIANDLGLNISSETDLVSIAQYHVNENRNRTKINRKILEEFTQEVRETENHQVISRLPISSIWTTNYDELIENTFEKELKVVDVKYTNSQLLTTKPKRDIVIYKMHGDVKHPNSAILTKEQYEQYHQTHEPFIYALTGELTTKTFLFIGFSFTDPNLDYILSRLNYRFREEQRQHYCFVKNPALGDYQNRDQATLDYNLKKQALIINDLKRYGIKCLRIDDYSEITSVLKEIETRYKKRTIFISGSAEIYEPYSRDDANGFVHQLSKSIIENDYRIVSGFGWGIGSSIINGALEAIYHNPKRFSESQLILKPFPQFETGAKKLPILWEEYRQKMISQCGVTIFLFGNKSNGKDVINANGVMREFEISKQYNNTCIPIGLTGYASREILNIILQNAEIYYEQPANILPHLESLNSDKTSLREAIQIVNEILKQFKN